jgi:hypothetical protein
MIINVKGWIMGDILKEYVKMAKEKGADEKLIEECFLDFIGNTEYDVLLRDDLNHFKVLSKAEEDEERKERLLRMSE